MTLTISLPHEVEEKLKRQAAASGRPTADYVSELIVQAVHSADLGTADSGGELPAPTAAAIEAFLNRIEQLEPDKKRPRLRGQEAEIEAMIIEKHYLKGRKR